MFVLKCFVSLFLLVNDRMGDLFIFKDCMYVYVVICVYALLCLCYCFSVLNCVSV